MFVVFHRSVCERAVACLAANLAQEVPMDFIDLSVCEGFVRLAFDGFAPGVSKRQGTSVFFREDACIFRDLKPPVRRA